MARLIRLHPALTRHPYHLYTDLDFWDARKLLKDLADVRRNFGRPLPGDTFPTQVISDASSPSVYREIEKRLVRAIISPPRHVIVRSMIFEGFFEFNPKAYYPARWSRKRMISFTYHRLPLQQSALSNSYQTVSLSWNGDRIRVDRVQRQERRDDVIRTRGEAQLRIATPSCF